MNVIIGTGASVASFLFQWSSTTVTSSIFQVAFGSLGAFTATAEPSLLRDKIDLCVRKTAYVTIPISMLSLFLKEGDARAKFLTIMVSLVAWGALKIRDQAAEINEKEVEIKHLKEERIYLLAHGQKREVEYFEQAKIIKDLQALNGSGNTTGGNLQKIKEFREEINRFQIMQAENQEINRSIQRSQSEIQNLQSLQFNQYKRIGEELEKIMKQLRENATSKDSFNLDF